MAAWAILYRERDWNIRRQLVPNATQPATGLTLQASIALAPQGAPLAGLSGQAVETPPASAFYALHLDQPTIGAALAALPDGTALFETVQGGGYLDVVELVVGSNPPPGT